MVCEPVAPESCSCAWGHIHQCAEDSGGERKKERRKERREGGRKGKPECLNAHQKENKLIQLWYDHTTDYYTAVKSE